MLESPDFGLGSGIQQLLEVASANQNAAGNSDRFQATFIHQPVQGCSADAERRRGFAEVAGSITNRLGTAAEPGRDPIDVGVSQTAAWRRFIALKAQEVAPPHWEAWR
jgi:hypothetical protein